MDSSSASHSPSIASAAPTGPLDERAPAVIEVRGLRCRYGDFEAVRGIDLEVRRGELYSLLGTNGAGKTTTLETLEGHRRADGGSVRVLGADPRTARREIAGRVGVVLQDSGLPEELTVAEALGVWCRLNPSSPGVTEAERQLARAGLDQRRNVRYRQLSGGERRRLDLALALSTDPELLFLDEPTTGMDPEGRQATWELLREQLRAGTTILMTTHYLEEAEALADRIAIMHEGHIAAEGTLAELVSRQAASVRCTLPPGSDAAALPELAGHLEASRSRDGVRIDVKTPHLQRDLTSLLSWARSQDVELSGLSASEASLSQVFLDISTDGRQP